MSVTFPLDDDEDEEDTSTEPTLIVDGKDDLGGDDEDEQDPWTITEAPQTSDRYGECTMPVTPALDPDLSPQSGMRFGKTGFLPISHRVSRNYRRDASVLTGMRRDTYLEFNRRLKIKRRSDFTIDFKTTEQDGVIFYTADERDIDFIALFLKGGQVRDMKILLWFILVSSSL